MTDMLRLSLLVTLLCVLACGCSRQESETTQAPTPSAHLPSTTLSDPLTEDEVRTFLDVLETLPGRQAPEFEPLAQVTATEQLPASQLVEVYRQEYRAMLDASRHGARWRKREELMAIFTQKDVTPEDFAALMIRMSCAVAAAAINPEIDLEQVSANADAQVERLVRQINHLDAAGHTHEAVKSRIQAMESLQSLVAFSEFSRILQQVPRASCEVVARHRSRLVDHLPDAGSFEQNFEQFERTIDSKIVPTSFEQSPPTR